MKQSKYNIVVPYNDQYIHYNMITKSIILSDSDVLDNQTSEFYDNGFLVDDDENEIKESELLWHKEQSNKNHLLLTVIPTFHCNLDCSYCYQHELHNTTDIANDTILKGILAQIKQSPELSSVHIEWTGGEPLLKINLIRDFSSAIIELCKQKEITYTSSISTNLCLLNPEILSMLVSSNITAINTTLAGTSTVHDKYRNGSFGEVWNNIIYALQFVPVSICINVTANAEEDICSLLDQLASIKTNNLSISFLLVEDYGYGDKSIYLEKETHFPIMLRLLKRAIDKGLKAEVNSNYGSKRVFCAAQMDNCFIIHPSGRIYKCENSYNADNSIGIVSENGFVFTKKYQVFNPYIDEKCSSCDILPYCNGGCQFNKESNKNCCPHEKNYLPDLLRLYVSSIT